MRRGCHRLRVWAVLGLLLAAGTAARAQDVSLSPDVTLRSELGASPLTVNDEDVLGFDAAPPGDVTLADLGMLPAEVAVTAWHQLYQGDQLFSIDVPATLGGTLFLPGDVIRYDGVSYTREFDSAARGIGADASLDALSVNANGLLLSFDVAVTLEGVVVAPEDVVQWVDGAPPTATLVFDGSAQGVPAGLNLDALHYDAASDTFLFSFDASGSIGGASFDDEDVVSYDPSGPSWSLYGDTSAVMPEWIPADLDAYHLGPSADNCPGTWNPDQADIEPDGLGDACDPAVGDPDADDDGLLDGEEVLSYGSDPQNPDSDSDGLSDGDEVNTYGTDPTLVDSDGDGWSDASEVAAGSDPNDSASVPAIPAGAPFAGPSPIEPYVGFDVSIPGVFAADLDRDADRDVVMGVNFAPFSTYVIYWYENDGAGGGWSITQIAASAGDVALGRPADIDGDGDPDVPAYVSGQVVWLENDLPTGLWPSHTVDVSGLGALALEAADVDGDGDLDVVAAGVLGGLVIWYENTSGDGSSWSTVGIVGTGATVAAADVDRDGDVDFVSETGWAENTNGDGSAWTAQALPTSLTLTQARVVDLDRDGDVDVVGVSTADGRVGWYENADGAGTSWTPHVFAVPTATPSGAVAAGDLDGDGDPDVAVGTAGPELIFYENAAGDASLWAPRSLSAPPAAPDAFDVADLDGDGDADLLGGHDGVGWWSNQAIHRSALFPVKNPIAANTGNRATAWADLDGDGDPDVLSSDVTSLQWHENTAGDGSAWTSFTIASGSDDWREATAADLDGDGDLDVLAALAATDTVAWYENDGTPGGLGDWSVHAVDNGGADLAVAVFAADIDRDGDLDVVAASANDDKLRWHENVNGDGLTWSATEIATAGLVFAISVEAADMDRDGDLDVVAAGTTLNTVSWYENDGTPGDPTWTEHLVATIDSGGEVDVVDVDGDGDPDILSAGGNTVRWHENTSGDGSSWSAHVVAGSQSGANRVQGADLDGDGDFDVLATASNGSGVGWWENSAGDGSTWTPHLELSPSRDDLSAVDIDRDGDLDLLSTENGTGAFVWDENRGGQFALPTSASGPAYTLLGTSVDMLTIDAAHRGRTGDGDVELASLAFRLDDGTTPLTSGEANALIDRFRIYLDTGSGSFEAGSDTLVADVDTLGLDGSGDFEVLITDGDPNFQVAFGATPRYFAVLDLQTSGPVPATLRLTHRTESSSTAEDASYDLPLDLEFQADTAHTVQIAVSGGDSDSDGLSDDDEINVYGTNPLDNDTDDDGLLDGAEVAGYSDPLSEDVDGDGICDGSLQVGVCTQTGPDNCPNVPNPGQTNSDAFAAGDACQCGDVSGADGITLADWTAARELVVGRTTSADPTRCDVDADGICGVQDLYAIQRAASGESATISNGCAAYSP